MGFLKGKKALILGLASQRSIAYGIAERFHQEGAELAFTYQNDKLKKRVEKFSEKFNATVSLPCDVSKDEEIKTLFTELKKHWNELDIIVHSVAFAPESQITGDFVDNISREGFEIAHNISSYSFAALAREARSMLSNKASLLTLSYLGAERAFPNYNVMGLAKASLEASVRYMAVSLGQQGIRVNAISAGPIRTLAASGIGGFRSMLEFNEKVTPLKKNVTIEEVGNTAAFLASDLASGITAEVLHVDAGFHAIGLANPDTPDTTD